MAEKCSTTIRIKRHATLIPSAERISIKISASKSQPHKRCLIKGCVPLTTTQEGLVCEVIYLHEESYLAAILALTHALETSPLLQPLTCYTQSRIHKEMHNIMHHGAIPAQSFTHSFLFLCDDILFVVRELQSAI